MERAILAGDRRDRRLPHARRRGSRHRRRLRARRGSRSATTRLPASCVHGWSRSAPSCSSPRLPDVPGTEPEPQDGRAHLRRQAHRRRVRDRCIAACRCGRTTGARGQPAPGAWFTVGGRRVKVWRARRRGRRVVRGCRAGTLTKAGALVDRRRAARPGRGATRGQAHDERRAAFVGRRAACDGAGSTSMTQRRRSVALVALERIENGAYSQPRAAAVAARFRPRRARPRLRDRSRLRHRPPTACARLPAGPTLVAGAGPARAGRAGRAAHGRVSTRRRRAPRTRRSGRRSTAVAGIAPAARGYRQRRAARGRVRRARRGRGRKATTSMRSVCATRNPTGSSRCCVRSSAPRPRARCWQRPTAPRRSRCGSTPGVRHPRRSKPSSWKRECACERGALLPDALVATGLGDVGALAAVQDGRATPQDQASQAVAQLVAAPRVRPARPPTSCGCACARVAAAPGGKATAIAELDP